MSQPFNLNPDYDPDLWALGYQGRQFGVAGDDVAQAAQVLSGLADPSEEMAAAALVVSADTPPDHVIVDSP